MNRKTRGVSGEANIEVGKSQVSVFRFQEDAGARDTLTPYHFCPET